MYGNGNLARPRPRDQRRHHHHRGQSLLPARLDPAGVFQPSETHTYCPWKGTASYYTVVVDGDTNPDAAWYYPEPKTKAAQIKDHVAFWRGVDVTDD